MSVFEHTAVVGRFEGPDHLYADCPVVVRLIEDGRHVCAGTPCGGTVDPLGTDICGTCVRRWRRTEGGTS